MSDLEKRLIQKSKQNQLYRSALDQLRADLESFEKETAQAVAPVIKVIDDVIETSKRLEEAIESHMEGSRAESVGSDKPQI